MRGFLQMGLLLAVAIAITAIVADSMQTWQARNHAARASAASMVVPEDKWEPAEKPAPPSRTREAARQ